MTSPSIVILIAILAGVALGTVLAGVGYWLSRRELRRLLKERERE